MPDEKPGTVQFASFLAFVNAIVGAAAPALLLWRGQNEYVNVYTVCLALAFAAQNHFFIASVKKRPDPFLLLLVFSAVFFYGLRVVTLLWTPWSVVLARNPFSASDLSAGLLYVMLANTAVFLASLAPSEKVPPAPLSAASASSVRLAAAALLFFAGLALEHDFGGADRVRGYLGVMLNAETLLLFLLVLAVLYYGKMRGGQRLLVVIAAVAFVVVRTASGSRSAALTLFFYLFCAQLAVKGRAAFGRKLYAAGLAAVPLAAALFIAGTLARDKVVVSFPAIFDRVGFLDMSSETAANSDVYSGMINFPYYLKSVVDNALTPGFSVFNAPKAANMPVFFYRMVPEPSLRASAEMYQSDMFTIYGEARVLFGPAAGLVWIFALSFLFRKVYRAINCRDPFSAGALRAMVLYIFYVYFLGSYGADWFAVDLIRGAIPFTALLYFVSKYSGKGRAPGDVNEHSLTL